MTVSLPDNTAAVAHVLVEGLEGPEGPVLLPDGSVVVTEVKAGRLTRVTSDGSTSVYAEAGGKPDGAARGPDGDLFVANMGLKRIQRIRQDRSVEVVYDQCDGKSFLGPNDLTFDDHGGFYFTDPGPGSREGVEFGWLYYGRADGSEVKRTQHVFLYPNGLALIEGGTKLAVLESMTGRVWGIPVESPGELAWADAGARFSVARRGNPGETLLAVLPRAGMPDGMCVDEAGNMLICAVNAGFISVHAPDGTPLTILDAGDRRPSNICFGGPEGRTLYVTGNHAGRVTTIEWEHKGAPLPYY